MEDMYSIGVTWGNIRRVIYAGEKKIKKELNEKAEEILLEIRQIRDDKISDPVISRKIYSLIGRAMLIGMVSKKFHDKVIACGFH
jgi:hypothetical protein